MAKQQLNSTPPMKEAEMNKSLKAIFREDSGQMPDLSKLERHRTNTIVWIFGSITSLLLIVLAAVWLGFSMFKPFHGFQGDGLELVVDGPEQVTLGQETTYFINYKNISSGPLAATEIRVSFPPDFSMSAVDRPATGDGLVWRLGALAAGERGTIKIQGFFIGALGTKTAIQVVGTFRPASFNSDFEQLTMRTLEYTDSVVDGVIERPEKVLPGDKVRIAYTLHNRGIETLSQLEARMTLPSGFVRDTSSTEALLDGSIARLSVGALAPNASTTVAVTGSFASGASGDLQIHAEVGRVSAGGTFQPVQKTDATIAVLAGDLLVHLVVNGSDASRSIGAQEPLRFALAYENTSPEEISGVRLQVIFEPVAPSTSTSPGKKPAVPLLVDWSRLEHSASGTVSGNTVSWSKDELGGLGRLPPQADGSIEFSLPVAAYSSTTADLPFHVYVQATVTAVGKTTINRTVKTRPIVFRLRSDVDSLVEARYFSEEGAQLGSGPLPPVVGQTTTYRIHWALQKTLHELSAVRMSATLPKNVEWPANASVSAGDITYDSSSRIVTWTLNRMPQDVETLDADFDVQLTPGATDAGRFADLLSETRLDATDASINEAIVRIKPALTTDLKQDEGARAKGVVKQL